MVYRGEIGFVRLLFALVSGILLTKVYADESTYIIAGCLFLLLFLACILVLARYNKEDVYLKSWIGGLAIHLTFVFLGYFLGLHNQYRYSDRYFASKPSDALIVVVRSEPQSTKALIRFEAKVTAAVVNDKIQKATGKLLVSIQKNDAPAYSYGNELLIPALYQPVEPAHNPAEFDYGQYLANRAVFNQVYLKPGQVKRIGTNKANPFFSKAIQVRNTMIAVYDRNLEPESAALMSTLLLGYRASLSKENIAAFTNTGTLHVLSVSGMHVGILALILGFFLLPVRNIVRARWLYPLLIIAAIWFYAVLTGLSAPVCRAALMLSCVLIGKALSRRQNSYHLIAISAFMLLLYDPLYLFDVGFQLSYLAVLGLIYLHPKLYAALYFQNYIADKVWSYAVLSVAAQIATLPLSLYYFHQLPVYFLPANLFIALPVMLIMLLGILMVIPIEVTREWLAWVLDRSISATDYVLAWIESWPHSTIQAIWLSVADLILLGILIWLLSSFGIIRKAAWLISSLMCMFLLVASFSYYKMRSKETRQVIFFSLKRDNPMAVIDKRKATIFTGLKADDPGIRFSVSPYLDKIGADNRQWIPASHTYRAGGVVNYPNYFSAGSWKMIRYDRQMRHKNFERTISVDVLLLTGNPYLDLEDLNKNVRYELLLIDASNSDRNIDKWIKQSKSMGIRCYVLKRNDAYIVDLSD